MTEKKKLIFGICFVSALLFLDLPGAWLFEPDEARYAEIPREMIVRNDFVTPTLNGSLFLEKPVLLYWLNAGSLKLFGETPFAARLPVRLAALGTALLLFLALKTGAPPLAGLWAAFIYLSSPVPFALGRINLTDGLLSFGLALTFLCLRAFCNARLENRPSTKYALGLGLGAAIAFLSKGLIALVFPGAVLVAWIFMIGRMGLIKDVLFSWAGPVFLAISCPWFILVEKANPGFLHFFFIREHFQRFTTGAAKRPGPFYYFFLTFVFGFMPWTFYFDRALKNFVSFSRVHWKKHADDLFFGLWFFSILVFFSISKSKLIPYLLPAFPAAAALVGKWAASGPENLLSRWRIQRIFWVGFVAAGLAYGHFTGFLAKHDMYVHAGLIGACMLLAAWSRRLIHQGLFWTGVLAVVVSLVPALAKDYSDHDLAVRAQAAGADKIVAFGCYPQNFPWVLKHPIPVVDFQGELASDGVKPAELFWDREKFWQQWKSETRMVVCVGKDLASLFEHPEKKPARLLGRNHRFVLLANFEDS